jgi:predicted GIY-YIG superfamily endonuclease
MARTTNKGWVVYLLSCGSRTYVGATTDIKRRIRQHNREISGGARSTAKFAPNWVIIMYVSGFKSQRQALRWEALIKRRARGLTARSKAMSELESGVCPPPRRVGKMYTVPKGLVIHGNR